MALTTTQLTITNGALRHLGQRKVVSTASTDEQAIVLNDIFIDGFVDDCLEQGQWTFATRTSMFDFSPSVQPAFGYTYSYNMPEDLVRTTGFWGDERLTIPITDYAEEAGYWFVDYQTVFISYISNAADYGASMARWPDAFCRWVEAYLAWRGALRITQSADTEERLEKLQKKLLLKAKSLNAMQKPTAFPPSGSWSTARLGGWGRTNRGGGGWL